MRDEIGWSCNLSLLYLYFDNSKFYKSKSIKIIGTDTDFKIIVVGYTNRDGIIPGSNLCRRDNICTNKQLGLARANSVVNYINEHWANMPDTATIDAHSAGDICATGRDAQEKALDRKVQFWVFFDGEEAVINDLCVKPGDEK